MWRGLSVSQQIREWVPLSWLPPCWSLRQVSQSPETLYGLFLICYALWALWMWSPLTLKAFPGGSDSKVSAYNARDPDSIPGLGRSPGEGNGNPLQYSCLERQKPGKLQSLGSQRVRHDWGTSLSFSFAMHFGSYGCDSPLTLKARCLGVYLTCIFHELGYLMWGSNPVLHREKPWVLSSLLIVDITSRMKFLVRLCLSFSYLLCYFIF